MHMGPTKSLKLDPSDNIYAVTGTEASVTKLAGSDGSVVWESDKVDSGFYPADIELIPTGGVVITGKKKYNSAWSKVEGCTDSCDYFEGAMIFLNADGTKAPTGYDEEYGFHLRAYGNYPGGVGKFAGLTSGNDVLIYTECNGITTTYNTSTNAPTGYALACGTGLLDKFD
jgi:hypothetical protein